MKSKVVVVLSLLFIFALLTGCQGKETAPAADAPSETISPSENSNVKERETPKKNKKTLIVYFSMPETKNADNMTEEEANSTVVISGKVLGNTQYVATVIRKNTGGDIFRIEPATPYPTDHETLVDLAKKEQNSLARPKIKSKVKRWNSYDTVFIGYPNWWGDMPMILYTFFDTYDFSGKTIIPFNTHGGSGFSETISTIKSLELRAKVNEDGFTVSRNNVQKARPDIEKWLRDIEADR